MWLDLMAVTIIGSGDSQPVQRLPEATVDLPGAESAPAGRRLVTEDTLRHLMQHPSPLIRSFALERAARAPDFELGDTVMALLSDADPVVFLEAVELTADRQPSGADEAVRAQFAESEGVRAAELAGALGRLNAALLPDAIRAHGRLDDASFPSVTAALAIAGGPEAVHFFKRALGRARLQSPERRRALFTSVLLSGDVKLCSQVLGEAIGDSNAEAPQGTSFPTRAAVATMAGLPMEASRLEGGQHLTKAAVELIQNEVVSVLPPDVAKAAEDALKQRRPGDILRALEPLTDMDIPEQDPKRPNDLADLATRRQGLLAALISRAGDLDKLDLEGAGLFLTAAAQAGHLIVSAAAPESTGAGLQALARALSVEPEALETEDLDALIGRFEALTARDMRRIHTILVRERFRRRTTLTRLAHAVLRAGHAPGLLAAAGETENDRIWELLRDGLTASTEDAETTVLEVLDERPLDEKATPLALALAEIVATERVALAVGRRFYELREIERVLTARTLLHCGDPRVLPLLESRAFTDEPEEAAWAMLSLATDRPEHDRVQEVAERLVKSREPGAEPPLQVELKCEHCGETGTYGFQQAFVDTEAKDEWGDPAFVGDVRCKFCSTPDRLKPTPRGGTHLTQEMLRFLQLMEQGTPAVPLVSPRMTRVMGDRVGLAEAMRRLDQALGESPDRIGLRLERASLRMVLERSGLDDDLSAVRDLDPASVEADVLEATRDARGGNAMAAITMLGQVHGRLLGDDEPRLYNAESPEALRESVEDLLAELSDMGGAVPSTIDLGPARARRRARDEELEAARAAAVRGPQS